MSCLKLPSQKVLAKYLKLCTETSSGSQSLWTYSLAGKSFTVLPSVWIQGRVVQVLHGGSTVIVDDSTGIIVLAQCDNVCSKLDVTKGMYIMAVGSLQSCGQCPVIMPMKLQDLTCTDHAEIMWPLEVIDQTNFLKN